MSIFKIWMIKLVKFTTETQKVYLITLCLQSRKVRKKVRYTHKVIMLQ
jgi:hypothetical protein